MQEFKCEFQLLCRKYTIYMFVHTVLFHVNLQRPVISDLCRSADHTFIIKCQIDVHDMLQRFSKKSTMNSEELLNYNVRNVTIYCLMDKDKTFSECYLI